MTIARTLILSRAKWPKMTKMIPASNFWRGYIHDQDKKKHIWGICSYGHASKTVILETSIETVIEMHGGKMLQTYNLTRLKLLGFYLFMYNAADIFDYYWTEGTLRNSTLSLKLFDTSEHIRKKYICIKCQNECIGFLELYFTKCVNAACTC